MEKINCVVDLAKQQITIEKYEAVLLIPTDPTGNKCVTANDVTVMKTFTIPAKSEIEMMAQVSAGSGMWLIEGNWYVHNGILVARAVVTPKYNKI